jgi:hypothetical protein
MPQDQKRRQKALERRAQRRKQKRAALQRDYGGLQPVLRAAARWPLYDCLVAREWQDTMKLTQVLVVRRSPLGQVAAGLFLVDLACLGVKDAFPAVFDSVAEYNQKLRRRTTERQAMIPADLNLAAKIIRESIAYARKLGFAPHQDYAPTSILLGNANPEACDVPVPLGGKNGKPFFCSGPYDNVPRIMAQLESAVGPGGFDFLIGIPQKLDWEEEEEEEDSLD